MRVLALATLVASLACGDVLSAPAGGVRASLALALAWPTDPTSNAVFGAGIDSVQVIVYRNDETTAYDSTLFFPPEREALTVTLDFPLRQKVETLYLYVDLREGPATLFYASSPLIMREGALPSIPPLPLIYIGPGSNATQVTITPRTSFLPAGNSLQYSATAYNSLGAPVPAPIAWSVSDSRIASVTASGLLIAKNQNGTVWIRALTPTGIADSVNVTVSNLPQSRAP